MSEQHTPPRLWPRDDEAASPDDFRAPPEPQRSPEPEISHDPFGEQRGPWWKRGGGGIAALGLLIAKFFAKIKVVLLLLPKLKILTTSGSMLVSVAAYSLIWGWKFAVGFVALLFVHEMGHVIQLRREGIKASAPVFIPFMGAAVWSKSLGDNAVAEARVGLAGPVLGSIGAAACIPIANATGNDFWKALAFTGFFLNLFNLLPVVPLDGGRAVAALHPAIWLAGLVGLVLLEIYRPTPILPIIIILGGLELWRRWQTRHHPETAGYYRVRPWQRLAVAVTYLGLAALLVLGMHATHVPRDF
jgi:Zn-dependent protease